MVHQLLKRAFVSLFVAQNLLTFTLYASQSIDHEEGLKIRNPISRVEHIQDHVQLKLKEFINLRKTQTLDEKAQQQVVTPDPRFQGWWQVVTRGNCLGFGFGAFTDDIDSYVYIDTSTFDPSFYPFVDIRTLCGTPAQPRECTPLDVDGGGSTQLAIYYVPTSTELVYPVDRNGPFFNPAFGQSFFSLKLQSDGETICASIDSQGAFDGLDPASGIIMRKVNGPQHPVRPYDDTNTGFPDITNPVEIAKYIHQALRSNYNPQQNVGLNDTDTLSSYDAEALFQKMITEGITYKTKIRHVRVSQPDGYFVNSGVGTSTTRLTDIFTEGYSYATPGATVKISGFKGKWAKMNGTYVNGVCPFEADGIPNPSPKHVDTSSTKKPKHGSFRNVYHHFLLNFDSSDEHDFPRDEKGKGEDVKGDPVVEVTHRFTPDMQYPEFYAAIRAMFFAIYKVSQHNGYVAYISQDSFLLIDTWAQLKEAIQTGNFYTFAGTTRTNASVPSGFYNNPIYQRRCTTYNDPFGITQNPNSIYNYNIVLGNYIVSPKNVYWALAGTLDLTPATPNGQPLQFNPSDVNNFYKPIIPGAQRAQFVGALGDIVVVNGIPVPQNPDPAYYSLLCINSPNTVRDANAYYIGLIDPTLTGNKKIGYLRWADTAALDFDLWMATSTFAPTVPVTAKYNREATSKVYAEFTKFFQKEHDCDAVILDIRTNAGGRVLPSYALAEFFGDDRPGIYNVFVKKDAVNSALVDFADPSLYSFYNNVTSAKSASYSQLFVQQNETNYGPGAVFKGTAERPKKVIILTDNAAASGGDLFPHAFVGKNLDGDLGAYTTCKIIGDIDGRLKGASTHNMALPVSKNSNYLYNTNNLPVSPLLYRADVGDIGVFVNGITNTYYNQQLDQIAPSFAPSLTGLAGGAPLPNDFENTVWPDLGFIKAPHGHFSKKIPKSNPKPTNPHTWRDCWLEQAILAAIED